MHRQASLILSTLLVLSTACQDQMTDPTPPLSAAKGGGKPPSSCPGLPLGTNAVLLTPAATVIVVGATVTLTAENQSGTPIPVCALKWSSTDIAIATVTNSGVVLGVAVGGPVTIKAQTSGKKPLVGTAFVTVGSAVASVDVTPPAADLLLGGTVLLTAVAKDADGNIVVGRPVNWTSSAPEIANVGADGTVTGVDFGGPVTITATVDGRQGSASITVMPVPVASVEVTPVSMTLEVGTTGQLTAIAKDADGNLLAGRTRTWSSSSAAIVTVDAAGLVTGVGTGSATITAESEGKTATSTIAVLAGPVARFALDGSAANSVVPSQGGTPSGVSWVADRRGLASGAGYFNGSAYVAIPPVTLNDLPQGSIAMWIRWDGGTSLQGLISKQHDMVNTYAVLSLNGYANRGGTPGAGTPGKVYWHPRNYQDPYFIMSATTLVQGQWYHIGVTWTSTTMALYINGVLEAQATCGVETCLIPDDVGTATRLGDWYQGGASHQLLGAMDEVRIYSRVLAAAEMAALAMP